MRRDSRWPSGRRVGAVDLPAGGSPGRRLGRRWLEDQFIANECEPLRAAAKVLSADKVLAVATALACSAAAGGTAAPRLRRATLGPGAAAGARDVEAGAITADPDPADPRAAARSGHSAARAISRSPVDVVASQAVEVGAVTRRASTNSRSSGG